MIDEGRVKCFLGGFCLLLVCYLESGEASGVIELKLKTFDTTGSRRRSSVLDKYGLANCCQGRCREKCIFTFQICVESSCATFKNIKEGYSAITDITSGLLNVSTTSPLNGTFALTLKVWESETVHFNTLKVNFSVPTTLKENAIWVDKSHDGGLISEKTNKITFSVRSYCNPGYEIPSCTNLKCMPKNNDVDGHYTCDKNGNKICIDGWIDPKTSCRKEKLNNSTKVVPSSPTIKSLASRITQSNPIHTTHNPTTQPVETSLTTQLYTLVSCSSSNSMLFNNTDIVASSSTILRESTTSQAHTKPHHSFNNTVTVVSTFLARSDKSLTTQMQTVHSVNDARSTFSTSKKDIPRSIHFPSPSLTFTLQTLIQSEVSSTQKTLSKKILPSYISKANDVSTILVPHKTKVHSAKSSGLSPSQSAERKLDLTTKVPNKKMSVLTTANQISRFINSHESPTSPVKTHPPGQNEDPEHVMKIALSVGAGSLVLVVILFATALLCQRQRLINRSYRHKKNKKPHELSNFATGKQAEINRATQDQLETPGSELDGFVNEMFEPELYSRHPYVTIVNSPSPTRGRPAFENASADNRSILNTDVLLSEYRRTMESRRNITAAQQQKLQ